MSPRFSLTASADDLSLSTLCAQIADMSFAEASIALADLNIRLRQKGARPMAFVVPVAYGPTAHKNGELIVFGQDEGQTNMVVTPAGASRFIEGDDHGVQYASIPLDNNNAASPGFLTAAGVAFAAQVVCGAAAGERGHILSGVWQVVTGAAAQVLMSLQIKVGAALAATYLAVLPANAMVSIPIAPVIGNVANTDLTATNALGAVAANTQQTLNLHTYLVA